MKQPNQDDKPDQNPKITDAIHHQAELMALLIAHAVKKYQDNPSPGPNAFNDRILTTLTEALHNPKKILQDILNSVDDNPIIQPLLRDIKEKDKLFQEVEKTVKDPDFLSRIKRLMPNTLIPQPITQEPDYSAKRIPEVLDKLGINLLPVEIKQHANQIIALRKNTPVEANLTEIPIASYKKGVNLPAYITYKDRDITSEVGSMYGCLTGFDEQVLKEGLFSLAVPYHQYAIFYGSLDQLRKRLGIPKGGRQYAQLKKSLKKLGAVIVHYSHFYHANDQKHDAFFQSPLFDYTLFLDTEPRNPDILFIFAPPFSANLIRGYHTFLKDKHHRALPTYLTKRIYEYLDKKLGKEKTTHKEKVLRLYPKVSIDCTRPADSLKALRSACRIVSKQTDITIIIQKNILIAQRNPRPIESKASPPLQDNLPQLQHKPQETQVIAAQGHPDRPRFNHLQTNLHNIGLKVPQISAICQKYPLEYLERHLEWLPYRHPRNLAACYLKAVKNNYSMPARYEKEQHRKRTERTQ